MKEENSQQRRFSSCTVVSPVLFPPRIDGRKLVRNASFGGYNELAPLPGLSVQSHILFLISCSFHYNKVDLLTS